MAEAKGALVTVMILLAMFAVVQIDYSEAFRNIDEGFHGSHVTGEDVSQQDWDVEGADVGGRTLLQALRQCPINFGLQNYSSILSVCKAPDYPVGPCCGSFVNFTCQFLTYFNDQSTNCATSLFSYLTMEGNYPSGLFASECHGGSQGLACPTTTTVSHAPTLRPLQYSSVTLFVFAMLLFLLSQELHLLFPSLNSWAT